MPDIEENDVLHLDLGAHAGGVALWGAVPPVYDTTTQPLDRGIHVHARKSASGQKVVDRTFRAVRVVRERNSHFVSELEAIYFMVTSVFGFGMKHVACSHCQYPHLDKDWFSVHPHKSHLCAGCGKHFRDTDIAIGNPIRGIQDALGLRPKTQTRARRKLAIDQAAYPGGIQIWGSNPAILWTGKQHEEEGIHVHAFKAAADESPTLDDTYSHVTIDGVALDPVAIRTLMAQSALPHLEGRIVDLRCVSCDGSHFDEGADAYAPATDRKCRKCRGNLVRVGRLRNVIGNPARDALCKLAKSSPRPPRHHDVGLLPETI